MAHTFAERLAAGPPICCDGGMGALIASAVGRLRCPEEANVRAPESVVDLHLGFIRAGAELIETNTFGGNRRKLASHFLENELEAINSAGVKLARDAREISGKEVFIAGSIGPLGDVGDAEDRRFGELAEQASVLAGRGVDVFMVETFYDLDEIELAIAAVRSVSPLPVVALMTFDEDAETLGGVKAAAAAERLRTLDVAAMGANHGAGLQAALTALEEMAGEGPPLAALPNLGLASLAGGRVIYPHATPEYFAEFAAQASSLGAGLIGGCCGTTPIEIAAIRDALDEHRAPSASFAAVERELVVRSMAPEQERDESCPRSPRRPVRRVDPGRSAARRRLLGPDRHDRGDQESGLGRLRRHQRQRDREREAQRDDDGRRRRAAGRHRDDPAPDDSRLLGARARGAPARGPRRGRAERPRRHRGSARGRRLSRAARGSTRWTRSG